MRRNRPFYRPLAQSDFGPTGSLTVNCAFSPTHLDGLTLWLDASDSGTLTKDGDDVSEWAEKAGGRYWRQATEANQPSHSVVTQQGKPVVSLAVDDYLDRVTLSDDPAPFTLAASEGPFTLFFVSNVSGTFGDAWLGNSGSLQMVVVTNNTTLMVVPAFPTTLDFTTPARGTGFHVDLFERDAGSPGPTRHWLDGSLSSGGGNHTIAYSFDRLGLRYPATDPYDGNMAEVLAYGALSDADKNQVLSYLYRKWGISGALI
jgi:hypothetical protein